MKLEKQKEAIELRKQGVAITKIAKQLQVAKSSVHEWTKHIPLRKKDAASLKDARHVAFRKYNKAKSVSAKELRMSHQGVGRSEIKRDDWMHVAGCMLYWAEGSKSKNYVRFTNCDRYMIKFFVGFLRTYYGVVSENMTLSLQYHDTSTKSFEELCQFWINELNIAGCRIGKPYVKKNTAAWSKHEYGVCNISVSNTELANRIWGSIQEYIGFDNPEGLYY